jgi:hypothetical protein
LKAGIAKQEEAAMRAIAMYWLVNNDYAAVFSLRSITSSGQSGKKAEAVFGDENKVYSIDNIRI